MPDPFDYYTISFAELQACGQAQGIDIRPASQGGDVQVGDILFIRSGFVSTYYTSSPDARAAAALRPNRLGKEDGQRWAGVRQEPAMLDWLHDSYFAAVAGDAPSFEAWPSHEEYMLHEYILALWGMPLGEMFDLEKLSKTCREKGRWTFFVTSAPNSCEGGGESRSSYKQPRQSICHCSKQLLAWRLHLSLAITVLIENSLKSRKRIGHILRMYLERTDFRVIWCSITGFTTL